MQVGLMVTNGGPHPPGKWAVATVGQIMQSVFGVRGAETVGQRKLEMAMLDAFENHHTDVQKHERKKLAEHGMKRLHQAIDPTEHLDDPIADIVAATKNVGTVEMSDPDNPGQTKMVNVAAHLAKPEVQQQLRQLIGDHFATVIDIERSWHADRNAGHPEAKAYRQMRHDRSAHSDPPVKS